MSCRSLIAALGKEESPWITAPSQTEAFARNERKPILYDHPMIQLSTRFRSLGRSADPGHTGAPSRPTVMAISCLNARVLTRPNMSFQRTQVRALRGPGPLNSKR